jgi:hypothetical protein
MAKVRIGDLVGRMALCPRDGCGAIGRRRAGGPESPTSVTRGSPGR